MNSDNIRKDIILMGPAGAGKTTIAKRIEHILDWPRLSLDELQKKYLEELEESTNVIQFVADEPFTSPRLQIYHYYVLERVFQDLQKDSEPHIVEFGYGHSLYEDEHYIHRLAETLSPYPNSFLLIPSADAQESVEHLSENIRKDPLKNHIHINKNVSSPKPLG